MWIQNLPIMRRLCIEASSQIEVNLKHDMEVPMCIPTYDEGQARLPRR